MEYETESVDPLGRQRPADPVYFENDIFNRYENFPYFNSNIFLVSIKLPACIL
jgi:hypothetical protein